MKGAISEMKRAKTILDEQITQLEAQKHKIENELQARVTNADQKMFCFKELIAQILTQTHS